MSDIESVPRADAQVTVVDMIERDPFEANPEWPPFGQDQVTSELARRGDPAAEPRPALDEAREFLHAGGEYESLSDGARAWVDAYHDAEVWDESEQNYDADEASI